MCSIYDNLRKGLGNVSKDRCIFIFLTLLSIFAGSYCCDIPALPEFEWFIHHSEFLKNISYSVVAAYIFYLVQYVISNYILGKKALKLLIPVRGWFAAKEGGSIDLKGQDVVLYETAIKGTLEQEKLYYRKKAAPFNLMERYGADDSVKEKIENLDIQVKKEQDGLYVCASLALKVPLTSQELEAIQNFLSMQYEMGIFDTPRLRSHSVEEGEGVLDFSVDTKEKFSQKEVQCEMQKKYEITSLAHPQFPWLHRIRALADINEEVHKGAWGGFVEHEQNLSQEGTCWIYDQAICCEHAVVERSAVLFQESLAKGNALVTGNAVMYQTSVAEGACRIQSGEIWDRARIQGNAQVVASWKTGYAPLILADSQVYGNVCGKVLVSGNVLPNRSVENQTQELLVFRGGDSVRKVNESKKKVKQKKQPQR